jgi:hypothetical protein
MSDNTTPPVATSSSGEIPVEILTAANAHLSHGKTFGGSPGAETPPISTVAHAFDSRLCVHCGKRRSAHDNWMSDQCPQGDGVFTTAPPPSVSQEGVADSLANLPHAVKAIRFDNVWAHSVISSAIISLHQQLADAELTARYQSDVARQADEAREKAETENAGLRADKERLDWMDGASRVELQTVTSSLDAIRIAVDAARPSPTT